MGAQRLGPITGEAARLSEYLSYFGLAATAPNQRPDASGLPRTTVRAYNGAETEFPLTVEALRLFGVEVEPVTDPADPRRLRDHHRSGHPAAHAPASPLGLARISGTELASASGRSASRGREPRRSTPRGAAS